MKNTFSPDRTIYIQSPSDLFYFSRYKNADAKILFYRGKGYYFTDERYFEEVERLPYLKKNYCDFYSFLKENNVTSLETDISVTIDEWELLKKYGVEQITSIRSEIDFLRSQKNEEEIEYVKRAQSITDKTFTDILNEIKEDISEKELERKLICSLYRNGAEGLAFDPIVAFGKNTSKPHAHPGETTLKKGDLITLDFGAKYNNYCSDMTRTVSFGQPTEEMKKTYNLVLNAQKLALDQLHAGISGKTGHEFAASYFRENGVDDFFTHSLGHSLGIDIHENPNLSPRNSGLMPENAVVSVEPGLYFPQKFGIRIEDIVVFTKKGVINLTNSEKKLIII